MKIDVEEHYEKIYRYCYFRIGNAQLAEDLTQETFLRFLESCHYRDTGRPLAYLYTIAKNLCIDEYRKPKRTPLEEEFLRCSAAENFEERTVEYLMLHEALRELLPEERELLVLRTVNEVPFSVLCELYHESRFSLHRRLKKITAKLERRMSDEKENRTDAKTVL